MQKRNAGEWSYSIGKVAHIFGVDPVRGLTTATARERLMRDGRNEVRGKGKDSLVRIAFLQLKSPLAYILLAAGVGMLLLGRSLDAVVIFIALSINVIAGTFQQERAGRAFERLTRGEVRHAVVIREGKKALIDASDVVRGDIVVLEAGYAVPADIRLFEANNMSLNESALTGEWEEVPKDVGEVSEDTPLAEQKNMARAGTLVVSGHGKGIVVATGEDTELGIIAMHLRGGSEGATPIEEGIRGLARFLLSLVAGALLIIFFAGLLRGENLSDMVLLAIAIGVAAVPSGLPAAVTVVLAIGMEALLRKGGLVRNLHAAETLGSTSVVLTDKTGTLTEAKMKLTHLVTPFGGTGEEGEGRTLLRDAVLSSHAFVEEPPEDGKLVAHGRPIERAIILAGLEKGLTQEVLNKEHVLLDFLPFDSGRRFGASLRHLKGKKRNRLYISGAPEILLARSHKVLKKGRVARMTKEAERKLKEEMDAYTEKGVRLIGVAYKDTSRMSLSREGIRESALWEELTFLGYLGFEDPLRSDAKDSVRKVREAGARVIMVTGDNPKTALSIALQSGISKRGERAVGGEEIEDMEEERLQETLRTHSVFARILPEQKVRLAGVLRDAGEVVAMTGDGINDAPALRRATIGVAVGSGTEVAKEASDLVLLENSISVIVAAISEGRRILDNIKKIVAYLLSTNFSEVILIGVSLAAGTPLPLLPTQILWANMVGEGLLSFSFAVEKTEEGVLERDPKGLEFRRIVTAPLRRLILSVAAITGGLTSLLYFFLLSQGTPLPELRTILFVALSFDSVFFVLSFKNLRKPLWRSSPFGNRYLTIAMGLSALLLVLVLALSPLRTLLSLTPLSFFDVSLLLLFGLLNLLAIEGSKMLFFRRHKRTPSPALRQSALLEGAR